MERQIATTRLGPAPSPLRTPPMSGTTASTFDGEMLGPAATEEQRDAMRASAEDIARDPVAAEAASAVAAAEAQPRQVPEEVNDGAGDGVGNAAEQQAELAVGVSRSVDDVSNQASVATVAVPLLVPVEDADGGAVNADAEKIGDEQDGLARADAEENMFERVPEHAVSAPAAVELLPQQQVPLLLEDAVGGADGGESADAEQKTHHVEGVVNSFAVDSAAEEGALERPAEHGGTLAAATTEAATPQLPKEAADAQDAQAGGGIANLLKEKDDVEGVISSAVAKDSVLECAAEHGTSSAAAAEAPPQEQLAEKVEEAPRPEAQGDAGKKPIHSTRGRVSTKVAKVLYNDFFNTNNAKELLVNLEKVIKEVRHPSDPPSIAVLQFCDC